ncbi:MAG: hypothetical protein ABJF23_34705, partial [Bryobacteraceae bacterium]
MQILAEQDVGPPWGLPQGVTLETIAPLTFILVPLCTRMGSVLDNQHFPTLNSFLLPVLPITPVFF